MNCRWLNAVGSALLLSTALVTVSCSHESRGVLFYVSATDGDDSNNGSASSPWKTIQRAANAVGAGATVIVGAGTYQERVQIRRSGRVGSPITYQAQGTVVMQGFTINADDIIVRGFEITNRKSNYPDSTGVFIRGAHNEVSDCYIHDILNHPGVLVFGWAETNNNLVKGNMIVKA